MAGNTKVERIPLPEIYVNQKFSGDLYFGDFFLHPQQTPISDTDLENFQFWKVEELEMRNGDAEPYDSDLDLATSALSNSLDIMEKDIANMQKAQTLYQKICDFVNDSYYMVSQQMRFPQGEPLNTIRQLIEDIRNMEPAILRFKELHSKEHCLEIHSVNSFILTVALASEAKMPQHQLINISLSAIFHEIGLPRYAKLISQNKKLSPQEFNLQKNHVLEGLQLLKLYNFPSKVIDGILQHHERLDGSGYPHAMSQGQISDFGRYLGLVCSYVAMTTDQEFRQARMAHNVILTLLKEAKVYYDAELVRLLVQLLSLYPIGSYVALNNGMIGRVLQNNQRDPRMPIILVLLGPDNKPIAESTVIQTNEKIRVSQPVPYKQIPPVLTKSQEQDSKQNS